MPDTTVSDVALGGMGIGGIVWALYEKWMRHKVDTANIDSNVSVYQANEALFNMMTQRLETLEKEVRELRAELARERAYTRTLVDLIAKAGVPVPSPPTIE